MKPTVTQLIGLLDKPALMKWANRIGLEGVSLDDYRKKSFQEGTGVHKKIENDLKHGIVFDNENFQAFKSKYEVVSVEPVIECEFYKGRADVLLKRDGVLYLFDFKNSTAIYFEQRLQLMAYKRVLNPDKIGIVNTDSFTENIIELTEDQQKQYIKILSALTVIWNAKQLI
jgi:hypothetical protein